MGSLFGHPDNQFQVDTGRFILVILFIDNGDETAILRAKVGQLFREVIPEVRIIKGAQIVAERELFPIPQLQSKNAFNQVVDQRTFWVDGYLALSNRANWAIWVGRLEAVRVESTDTRTLEENLWKHISMYQERT